MTWSALGAKIDQLARRTRRTAPATRPGRFWGMAVLVTAWWLAIAAVVVHTMPDPVASAPTAFVVTPGRIARIDQPGLPSWPIPTDRTAFDQLRRAYREADDAAIEHASGTTGWISVRHGQAVRVVAVDGDAVQVSMLEGEEVGRRGWLLTRYLNVSSRK